MEISMEKSCCYKRLLVVTCLTLLPGARLLAQPSATDFLAGQILKIDLEAARITLRHGPIAHLSLPAGTTSFRYFESRWVIGRRPGDRVLFRADRFDLALRLTMLVYVPQ